MNASLVLIKADGTQKEIPLRAGKAVVGRETDAHIRIPVSGVSRKHAEFEVRGTDVIVRDLGSRNGTYVNAEKVSERALRAGDAIAIDEFDFVLRVDGKPAAIDPAARAKALPLTGDNDDSDFGLTSPKPVAAQAATKPAPAGKKPAPPSDPGDSSVDGFNFDDLLDDEKNMPKL